MEAANGGYVEVGELLLEYHADANTTPVPSSRDTALTIAADKGHDKFVEMLVQRGASIDARNKKVLVHFSCHIFKHISGLYCLMACFSRWTSVYCTDID